MIKKFYLFLLSCLMILCFTGCNDKTEELEDRINELEQQIKEENKDNNTSNSEEEEEFNNNSDLIKVPDVSGLSVKAATELLKKNGFAVNNKVEEVVSSDIDKGLVVKTNPSKNTSKKKGTNVTLYISSGETTLKVDDYTGKDYRVVKALLETKGIVVTVYKTGSIGGKENTIVSQSVEKGKTLKKGDSITLFIPESEEELVLYSKADYNNVLKKKIDCLIVFRLEGSTHCADYRKVLDRMMDNYTVPVYFVDYENVDVSLFGVQAFPTTHFVKNGVVTQIFEGAMSYNELTDILSELKYK